MSFSVNAREFVPSSLSALTSAHRNRSARLTKDRVCMSFFDCGECPFADNCEHAHSFYELSSSTQAKLLSTMPVDHLPQHFLRTLDRPNSGAAHVTHRREPASTPADPSRRRMGRKTAQQRLPLDTSVLSHTSSSATLSKPSSPLASAAESSFKMRLPARCRYPHQNMPGTYYDALGVAVDATAEDILSKYNAWRHDGYKRMRLIDPNGADATDRLIVEARNVLGCAAYRREYDRSVPGTMEHAWSKGLGGGHDTSVSQSGQTQGHSSCVSSSASDVMASSVRQHRLSSSVVSHVSVNSFTDDIW